MIRIGSSGIDNLGNGSVGSVGGVGSETSAAAASRTKSDSVSLSNSASLVALAKSGAASRQSKIQSLSAEVKSGRYQADTSQISHAVVENHVTA
jgi:anti-sigma28 factor (negative regulator of flagellin synthesis)